MQQYAAGKCHCEYLSALQQECMTSYKIAVIDVAVADGVYEKDKERLANMMAFGRDITPASVNSKVILRRQQQLEVDSDEETDRFQEC